MFRFHYFVFYYLLRKEKIHNFLDTLFERDFFEFLNPMRKTQRV